jgi:RimJ/RimL family protein N-acetyltransferase
MGRFDYLKLIPIYNNQKEMVGYLRPVTKDYRTSMPECAGLVAKWHNEHPEIFGHPMTVTEQTTQEWLDTSIIERDDRILFIIVAIDGAKIGHIGLSSFRYDQRCCEVDSVLRGEQSGHKRMMGFALNSLIDWGIKYLKLEDIELKVTSDNKQAIDFYRINHFYILKAHKPHEHETSPKSYTVMKLHMHRWKKENIS